MSINNWIRSSVGIMSFGCLTFLAVILTNLHQSDMSEYLTQGEEKETTSTRCFTCDNYINTGPDAQRPSPKSELAWLDGSPMAGGASVQSSGSANQNQLTPNQCARLCIERVNRSAMHKLLIDSVDYGTCPDRKNPVYDGCAKLVTKSYRVQSQVGIPQLAATVVSRTCAVIPRGYGVGCRELVGGAGLRRTICYCRGQFCNRGAGGPGRGVDRRMDHLWLLGLAICLGFIYI